MKTKEEVIKEAWGEYYSELVNENGELDIWKHPLAKYDVDNVEFLVIGDYNNEIRYVVRPKALKGIDDNNGWVKVIGGEEFPELSTSVWVLDENGDMFIAYLDYKLGFYTYDSEGNDVPFKGVTYYRLIDFPELPLYF